jgi:hypothetical protein
MDLLPFWIEMIVVFGVFLFFYYLENHVFKKRFSESHSQFDGWILALIVVRNIVFLLNFIPFIQILGGLILISVIYIPIGVLGGNFGVALLGLAVPAHLILYVTLLVKRHKNSLP